MSSPKVTPLLMTRENVIATREGRKDQTRRVITDTGLYAIDARFHGEEVARRERDRFAIAQSRYGQPGDRLALKQTWWGWGYWINDALGAPGKPKWRWVDETYESAPILFDADFAIGEKPKQAASDRSKLGYHRRPSIYLPKEAWGPMLELTEVRVERLQDISEEDAEAEGVLNRSGLHDWDCHLMHFHPDHTCGCGDRSLVETYARLWDSINGKQQPGKPDISWKANPWVWALTFKPLS